MSTHCPNLEKLVQIMTQLRTPDGCPWDREQTHATLKPYLLEEAYEVLEAIDAGNDRDLIGELGDVLLQVVFHAQIAAEEERFTIEEVAAAIVNKLIRRHPHVFADVKVDGSDHVVTNWERIKRSEREELQDHPISALDGVPAELPALLRAQRIQDKASKVGFDWKAIGGTLDKVSEEFAELRHEIERSLSVNCADEDVNGRLKGREIDAEIDDSAADDQSVNTVRYSEQFRPSHIAEEMGDLLFALVNVGRFLGLSPEDVLRRAVSKFERRFRLVEDHFRADGRELQKVSLAEMDRVWNEVKERE